MLHIITTYADLDGPRLMAVYAESNLENTDYFFPDMADKALAVRKVEDPEQRIISMNVEDLGEEVAVTVTNYYAEEPDIRDGVAFTGKQDVNRHGFGTMSMRYIAEQYHGHMAMEARNGIFRLYITLRKPAAGKGQTAGLQR